MPVINALVTSRFVRGLLVAVGLSWVGLPGAFAWQATTPSSPAREAVPTPSLTRSVADGSQEAGTAAVGAPEIFHEPELPADIQLVRLQGPEGVVVEVLGPEPVPVPRGDGHGWTTLGLRVGVSYQLRLSNLPGREQAEDAVIYPVIQLVGHLHRPPGIDAARYPIRIQLTEEDFEDVLRHGRLVTHVVYLEDPDQAIPVHLPKDEIPVVTLSPAEDALKVASALGRPMAIVQVGTRAPLPDDLRGDPIFPLAGVPCPFLGPANAGRCALPCGPCAGTPPPPGQWMPKDEFLCDGGDFKQPAGLAGNGGMTGIDPRDAAVRFHADRTSRPRVLPTNMVCIYAPRFAAVRRPFGATSHTHVEVLAGHELLQRQEVRATKQSSKRMTQNLSAQGLRERSRPSEVESGDHVIAFTELRILAGLDTFEHIRGHVKTQGPMSERNPLRAQGLQRNVPPLGIKTAEGAVLTGIVTGANEQVMAWKPQETVGVEEPPDKPGMAVIKQVDNDQAEPGDVLTYTIRFRNMGNVPIHSVSIVDNLLPRLEYIAGSAQGPKGSVFTASPNEAGSSELRWDLPGAIAPGAQGAVTFQVKVR